MFERHHEPLIPHHRFIRRLASSAVVALALIAVSLGAGVLGYHSIAGLDWIDALLNAAMILSGMGPVDEMHTTAAKVFAAVYALFSGLMVLTISAILFAPLLHRLMHHFHVDESGRSRSRKS